MLQQMWSVLLELAPWLLLGAAVAAVLHVVLPPDFIERHLRGRGGVLKAVALGVPLPLCSCGVIPTGLSLKKKGASDGASVGFLISTPQTGVDSVLVSASFLGWPFALFKVASAAVLGIVGGVASDAVAGRDAGKDAPNVASEGAGGRTWRDGWEHAVMLIRTIWRWLVVGIVASAALSVWLPQDALAGLGAYGGAFALGAVLLVAVPMYVCATASVPIAAALVAGGMPPGAALVFLMAGPATNVATIGAVSRTFGRRTLAVYLGTIVLGSLGLGALFDSVLAAGASEAVHVHGEATPWAVASAVVLLGAIVWFAFEDLRGLVQRLRPARKADASVPTVEVPVQGMTCQGCVRKLQGRLGETDGVRDVEVQLEPGLARVQGEVSRDTVCSVIREAGFEPEQTPRAA
jgi:hypothetical protein